MVTIEELSMFVVLTEERHFGRAAERCHVSTSALSKRIRHLEQVVGAELFDRTSRRVHLTQVGSVLVDGARSVLEQADAFECLAMAAATGKLGRLRLLHRVNHAQFVSDLLRALARAAPEVEIDHRAPPVVAVQDEVLHGRADVALCGEQPLPGLASLRIDVTHYDIILVPHWHALAGKDSVDPIDLDGETLLWAGADPTEIWCPYGVTFRLVRVPLTGRDDYATRIEIGQGIGLSTSGSLPALRHRQLVPIPLRDPQTWVDVEQVMVWRADDSSPLVATVVETARQLVSAAA